MSGWALAICLTVELGAIVAIVYFNHQANKHWREAERNWKSAEANWRRAEANWRRVEEMATHRPPHLTESD